MKGKRKKLLNLVSLFIFLSVTLSINFFHTETTIEGRIKCPACSFLTSSIITSQINFFYLPPPTLSGILKTYFSFIHTSIITINPTSRAPPEI